MVCTVLPGHGYQMQCSRFCNTREDPGQRELIGLAATRETSPPATRLHVTPEGLLPEHSVNEDPTWAQLSDFMVSVPFQGPAALL
jgi:hypothetical protein